MVPLPRDPDAEARDLSDRLLELTGVRIGVIISDTVGRPWRIGQTDIAIGAAGITPYVSFEGVEDAYGNVLAVTAPAVADEIAGTADLVAGKLSDLPVIVVRGLPAEWLIADAEGASALIREEGADMFGLGARDAVLHAVGFDEDLRGFPSPEPDDDLVAWAQEGVDLSLADVRVAADGAFTVVALASSREAYVQVGVLAERLRVLARALGRDVAVSLETRSVDS